MKVLRAMIIGALLMATLIGAGCSDESAPPRSRAPKIAVYSGVGSWAESVTAGKKMFEWMGYRCEIVSAKRINEDGLEGFDLLYVPGGDMYQYALDILPSGKANIRSFVGNGGGYIGVCGGAYFASRSVVWRGTEFVVETLQLFEGTAEGPVNEIVPYPGFGMCEVAIVDHTHPITRDEPPSEWMLYYWGPTLTPDPGVEVSILGTYALVGRPAMIAFGYGRGRVFLIGTHPEIEEDSNRDGVTFGDELDDRGSDWYLMRRATWWCLGKGSMFGSTGP